MSNPQGGIKKPSTLIEKEEAESSSVPTICHPICHLGDSSPASEKSVSEFPSAWCSFFFKQCLYMETSEAGNYCLTNPDSLCQS